MDTEGITARAVTDFAQFEDETSDELIKVAAVARFSHQMLPFRPFSPTTPGKKEPAKIIFVPVQVLLV